MNNKIKIQPPQGGGTCIIINALNDKCCLSWWAFGLTLSSDRARSPTCFRDKFQESDQCKITLKLLEYTTLVAYGAAGGG
jgi:hypothetical protein